MSKFHELLEELKTVLGSRVPVVDVIGPPLIFTLLNGRLNLFLALILSISIASMLVIFRLLKGQSLWYAGSGLLVILLSAGLSLLTQTAAGYYLPGVITSGLTFLLAVISMAVKRPLAAWTSHLTRNWPLDWYWHPRIRPAYRDVTLLWSLFFGFQFVLQVWVFRAGTAQTLGWVQLLTGWPALIVILVISYLYGLRRLQNLNGPSLREYQEDVPPPWEGQKRGF